MRDICDDIPQKHIFIQAEHCFSYSWRRFQKKYHEILASCNLDDVQLILAEHIDSLGILILMRLDGYRIPAHIFPHINAFPLEVLTLFSIFRALGHEEDIVVCGCTNTAKRYQAVLGVQTLAIPTFGISDDFYPMDSRWCRKKLHIPQHEKILLFTGRFAKDKAIPQLLRVYQQLKSSYPLRLVLILSAFERPLWNRTQNLLSDVHIIHSASIEELRLWYNAADIFSFPGCSIFETWGRAPIEAIVCHTPVVLADWCGFREYVSPHNGRLCAVQFEEKPVIPPFHYAGVREEIYRRELETEICSPTTDVGHVPAWTQRDFCIQALKSFVAQQYAISTAQYTRVDPAEPLQKEGFSPVIQLLWDYFRIDSLADLRRRDRELSWLNRGHRGSDAIIAQLYQMMYARHHQE